MNIQTLITGRKQPQQMINAVNNRIVILVKRTTRLALLYSTIPALLISSQCLAETRPIPTRQPVFNQVSLSTTNHIIKGTGIVSLGKQSGTDSIDSFIQLFSPFSTQIQPMPKKQPEAKSQQTDLESDEWRYLHILIPLITFVIGLCIALDDKR